MMRRFAACLIAACCVGLAGVRAAEIRRVALPPAPATTLPLGKIADGDRLAVCLPLHLRERLSGVEGVRIVSDEWSAALYDDLRSRKRVSRPDEMLGLFARQVPVDAVCDWSLADGKLTLRVYRADGVRTCEIAFPEGTALARIAPAAGRFVAESLGLSAQAAAHVSETGVSDPRILDACWLSRRLHGVWITNSGEARLGMLRDYMDALPKEPLLAEAILDAGMALNTDRRKPVRLATDIQMIRLALPVVLGTPKEAAAAAFLRVNRLMPETIEEALLESAKRLIGEELEMTGTGPAKAPLEGPDGVEGVGAAGKELLGDRRTTDQEIGALRCLGLLRSPAALKLMSAWAGHKDARVREAAAFALGRYPAQEGAALLTKLAHDRDPAVAFAAAYGLWKTGQPAAEAGRLAAERLAADPASMPALEMLGALAAEKDAPVLRRALAADDAPARAAAARTLIRLQAAAPSDLDAWLNDPAIEVVRAALSGLSPAIFPHVRERLFTLADDPCTQVAEATRGALAAFRPSDAAEAVRFDLATEHPYVRGRIVERLARDPSQEALRLLAEAVRNSAPHVRARALLRLAERDAVRAAPLAAAMLSDPYRWARLHAASVSARVARPEDADTLRKALEQEPDEVTRLYLADALARAEGKPAPAARPAVNPINPSRNHALLCGYGEYVEDSPMQVYYMLSTAMSPAARRAHEKGKVFIGRVNSTVKNPGQVLFDSYWRDGFWIGMEDDLADLAWLDGVVLGEESMYAPPNQLWPAAWRLFCLDAGIDPARVGGELSRLSPAEAGAWRHWEKCRAVEGFNVIYDYVKLRYGKARPGFMVATFMPQQDGPNPADREWRFDVGGGYSYHASLRATYTAIRRYKTLWPDRPVLWLSLGCGETGLKSPKYDSPVPSDPVPLPAARCFADSVAAWLAGAETGWFSIWLFAEKDSKSDHGVWVQLEDIAPDSPILKKAVDYAFSGIEEFYLQQARGGPNLGEEALEKEELKLDPEVVESAGRREKIAARVKAERQRLFDGFLMEQRIVYDCARALSDLPRLQERPEVLLVGGSRNGCAGFALPGAFDYLAGLDALAGQDLSRYRMVVVDAPDAPLRDEAIAAVTEWLRNTPGLLYVHMALATDNTREAPTPEDHDGLLKNDWPWETDVAAEQGGYRTGGTAEVLSREADRATLVFWTGPGLKGAVLFDAGSTDAAKLAQVVRDLVGRRKVGCPIPASVGVLTGTASGVVAAASDRPAAPVPLEGIDLVTGRGNPVLGEGRGAALVSKGFQGRHVLCVNDIAVLCEKPILEARAVPGGLIIRADGLIRAACPTGAPAASADGGRTLPEVKKEDAVRWITSGGGEGMLVLPLGAGRPTVLFIRSGVPVTLMAP